MALTTTELDRIEEFLLADASSHALPVFRTRFPGVSLTRCDVSDMNVDATPYKVNPDFELYLVDGRDHCWTMTQDPTCATGIVLAMRRARSV